MKYYFRLVKSRESPKRDVVLCSGLNSFAQWIHLEAKDHDLEFVQTVVYFSTQILNRTDPLRRCAGTWNRQISSSGIFSGGGSRNIVSPVENGIFHVHPKKITEVK